MSRNHLVAFFSGSVFAIGLALSGMTQPAKVIAFLDVTGHWDPSLAFVMVGAIAVHFLFLRMTRKRATPFYASQFVTPTLSRIDSRLLVGAALFGLGWGIAGFCPGPAVVSIVTGAAPTLLFVASMLAGMGAYAIMRETRAPAPSFAATK
jgi:uncharacterized membrane protein YedE/YeeE